MFGFAIVNSQVGVGAKCPLVKNNQLCMTAIKTDRFDSLWNIMTVTAK